MIRIKKKKGTYLVIELVFVVCVLAVLSAAGIVHFDKYNYEAKVSVAQNETMQLGNAVAHYQYDTGKLPESLPALSKAGDGELQGYGPWIPDVKNDPWGNEYILQPGTDGYVVYCTENGAKTNANGDSLDQGVIGFHGL